MVCLTIFFATYINCQEIEALPHKLILPNYIRVPGNVTHLGISDHYCSWVKGSSSVANQQVYIGLVLLRQLDNEIHVKHSQAKLANDYKTADYYYLNIHYF